MVREPSQKRLPGHRSGRLLLVVPACLAALAAWLTAEHLLSEHFGFPTPWPVLGGAVPALLMLAVIVRVFYLARIWNRHRGIRGAGLPGMLVVDKNGHIRDWNWRTEEMLRLGSAQLRGAGVRKLFSARDHERLEGLLKALAGDEWPAVHAPPCTLSMVCSDGAALAVDFDSEVFDTGVGRVLIFTLRDATDRIASETVLRRYQLLAEHTNDVVVMVDADIRVIEANAAALRTYGYSREEVLRLHANDLRPEGVREGVAAQVSEALRTKSCYETVHRRKDGTTFPVEISTTKAEVDSGLIYVCIIRDITQRKRLEAVRKLFLEVDQRVLQQEPLASVGRYMCERLQTLLELPLVFIGWKEASGVVSVIAEAGPAIWDVAGVTLRWDAPNGGTGPTGLAIATGTTSRMSVDDPDAPEYWRQAVQLNGLVTCVAFPLKRQGETVGSLTLCSAQPNAPDADVCDLLTRYSEMLSLSLTTALAQDQSRLKDAALAAATNAMVIVTPQRRILWVNPAFVEMTEFTKEEVVGQDFSILRHGDMEAVEEAWASALEGRAWSGEAEAYRKDGTVYVEEATMTPVRDKAGLISHVVWTKQNISEKRAYEYRLQFLETHDPHTALPNWYALKERLNKLPGRPGTPAPIAIIVLDLDDFRAVNNVYGYAGGNTILCIVGSIARRIIRKEDLLALYGDRFTVLMENVPATVSRSVAERLRQEICRHPYMIGNDTVALAVSVGVAYSEQPTDPSATLALAEVALGEAKGQGKNQVVFYGPGAASPPHWRYHSQREMLRYEAGHRDQLRLLFQPVIPVKADGGLHHEVLIRMVGENGVILPPAAFIPGMERSGLMGEVDRWVVENALQYLAENPDLSLFVNLSGQTLGDPATLEQIEEQLGAQAHLASRLAFEITETTAVRDLLTASEWMSRVRSLGCRFALDDFGIGFSSFAYLRAFPVDLVKIDGSFTRHIDTDPKDRAMFQAICMAAHSLQKAVVAECVETRSVADLLAELSVEYGQGYFYSPPLHNDPPADRPFLFRLKRPLGEPGSKA